MPYHIAVSLASNQRSPSAARTCGRPGPELASLSQPSSPASSQPSSPPSSPPSSLASASSPSSFSSPSPDASTSHASPGAAPSQDPSRWPRRAGVLLPLFSIRSAPSWGLGEVPDLARAAIFCRRAGLSVLQLLPVSQILGDETSPYSASSAFAFDPTYLSLENCEDFVAPGGRRTLDETMRQELERVQASASVDWPALRRLKRHGLGVAFQHFLTREWGSGSARAGELRAFIEAQSAWLPDHALFVALHARHGGPFWRWPAALASRQPAALAEARSADAEAILAVCWQQWQLAGQWRAARRDAADLGVELMGDLPFMVAADSSDVWSRPTEFRRDRRIGTPPDAFSAEGQDWGLPAYDFPAMEAEGFSWMRARAAQAAETYGLSRLDHVIGMYRTYSRPLDSDEGTFEPSGEAAQLARGETLLGLFARAGRVVAEDLGLLPDYLRPSLDRLGIPGYRVLRWEKRDDGSFRDPAHWPVASVATTGTHDIEPNALWWDELPAHERAALVRVPALAALDPRRPFDASIRDALLEAIYGSPSALAIAPLQDLLGTRERVNVPGTVSTANWTTRMSEEVLALAADRDVCARLSDLATRHRR